MEPRASKALMKTTALKVDDQGGNSFRIRTSTSSNIYKPNLTGTLRTPGSESSKAKQLS